MLQLVQLQPAESSEYLGVASTQHSPCAKESGLAVSYGFRRCRLARGGRVQQCAVFGTSAAEQC